MTHKEKILKYLEYKGVKPAEFYRTCKFSNGFLDSGKSFGTDKLTIILDNYRDINLRWLLYDEGEMLLTDTHIVNEPHSNYGKEVKEMLYKQIEENLKLKSKYRTLQKTLENLKKKS